MVQLKFHRDKVPTDLYLRFNSCMVQLKSLCGGNDGVPLERFNSCMVQLK